MVNRCNAEAAYNALLEAERTLLHLYMTVAQEDEDIETKARDLERVAGIHVMVLGERIRLGKLSTILV